LLEERSERAQVLQARALADKLEVHLRGELELVEEASNAELVARSIESYEDLVVPDVIRPYVTEKELVLERLEGRKVEADHGLAVAQNRADDVADLILCLSRTSFGADEPGFIQELRRKLPRYHWRPLSEIHAGEALADLQRISFDYGIALPTTFALVGKTLAQADSIARVLYPELDPIALLEEDSLEVMLGEGERRL